MIQISNKTDVTSSMSPLVAVSPHFDDAVFSCGNLLALAPGSTVITIYTGVPENPDVLTDWDRRCGFSSARDAMQARASENRKALDLLHATGVNLEFLDSQYVLGQKNGTDLLSDTLASTITQIQPAAVIFPLGLFHEDHINVSDALITICHRFPLIHWLVYEDIPYSKRSQEVLQRLSRLVEYGVGATPMQIEDTPDYKAAAVNAYRSQFRGLGYTDGQPVLRQPERYWRLHCSMDLL